MPELDAIIPGAADTRAMDTLVGVEAAMVAAVHTPVAVGATMAAAVDMPAGIAVAVTAAVPVAEVTGSDRCSRTADG